jgi:hypothetical protein
MNRRSFFKFLPIAPVVMISEGARAATADQAPSSPMMSFQLTAQKPAKHTSSKIFLTYPQSDPTRQVSMAVGNDGRLWLKSKDDVWKRVVTE